MCVQEEMFQKIINKMKDPTYWHEAIPFLNLDGNIGARYGEDVFFDALEMDDKKYDQLLIEGYCQQEDVYPKDVLERLSRGVKTLYDKNIHPVFLMVYDEIWLLARITCQMVKKVLGDDIWVLPASWVWYVEPGYESSGWRPHRERTKGKLFNEEGIPSCLSVWIPINDALPINGCMSVVPANLDPYFPDHLNIMRVENLQSIRSLPAKRGDFLCWNQAVIHWGGRSSPFAPFPRISLCFELQTKEISALQRPVIDPFCKLSLEDRLFVISLQILNYQHLSKLDEEFLDFARMLSRDMCSSRFQSQLSSEEQERRLGVG